MIFNRIILMLIMLLSAQLFFAQLVKTHNINLPERGICAHRGAMDTHPENTIAAFKEAIRLGAHMIEFDVRMTKDGQLVIMHDRSVDRTTNGSGLVSDLTFDELKKLDAGSWKSNVFNGEKIPSLRETLQAMPNNIWLNIHLKGGYELGKETAEMVVSENRMNQGVIACEAAAASGVFSVNQNIIVCNMERQADRNEYVKETIRGDFGFIQLLKKRDDTNLLKDINAVKNKDIKVNYFFGDTENEVKELFELGIDFVLTNKLSEMMRVAESIGIKRQYQSVLPPPKTGNTYVIAHRGVHHNIPENTLAAYQKAIDLGCDFVEIDLRKSKDGRFVSVHDDTIDAYVEGTSGKVNQFTLTELKQLNIGNRVGPQWENERIPTFEEILELCKDKIGIYLDLKEADVKAQIEIIKSYEMERDIIWYIPVSEMKAIMDVRKYCSECIVMPDPGKEKNIVNIVKKTQPAVIATDMGELSENFVKIAHKYGSAVFTDDYKATIHEWEQILQWGTDGIQTDQPEKLIHFLKNR